MFEIVAEKLPILTIFLRLTNRFQKKAVFNDVCTKIRNCRKHAIFSIYMECEGNMAIF
jgi:hypothetical protein